MADDEDLPSGDPSAPSPVPGTDNPTLLAPAPGDEEAFGEGGEDRPSDATREVSLDETALGHRASPRETRVARRREETAVRGETTLLNPASPEPEPESQSEPERQPQASPEPERQPQSEPEPGPQSEQGFETEPAPHPQPVPEPKPHGGPDAEDEEPVGDPLDAVEVPYGPPAQPAPPPQPAAPVPPPPPQPKPRRTMAYVFIGIAAVVVAAVIIAFVTWRLELWGGTTVPDVMGLSESEATAQLEEAGFEVAVEQVVVDEGAGTVVSMQPQAGRRVATGRTVALGIGVERVVPELEGLALDEARARLSASGIEHLRLEYQDSSAPKGTITAVSPTPGTRVAADEVVTLVVAQPHTVPDVIDLPLESAEDAIERAGLKGTVHYVASDTVEAGRVVSTDPVAGTELDEGAEVILSVSSPYPTSLFDLEGYLSSRPEDVSTYLGSEGYGVEYARDEDGVAEMTWAPTTGTANGRPSVGFTPLPFSLPSGLQLFPQDVLLQGAQIQGVYLQVGEGAPNWAPFLSTPGPGAGGQEGGTDSIDARATGGSESIDLDVSQDCITRLMNLCGLRSTADTTTTATQETIAPELGAGVNLAAKAGTMDGYTWYVVVWEPLVGAGGTSSGVQVALGMAPTDQLDQELSQVGYDLSRYGDSMANLAASLVLTR